MSVREIDPDPHHDAYSKTVFGFWIFIITDFMVFATLFAAYAVLHTHTFGGPSAQDLFHLPFTLTQTLILLVSSFTVGCAGATAHRKLKGWTIALFALTFLLGCAFMVMQFDELSQLIQAGSNWQQSAFLSMFFTIVGTLGAHVLFGLLWVIILLIPVCCRGLTPLSVKRLTCLRMFWQFLNVVWVFIFSIVYLMGAN